ncbi:hypothetical protein [Streptomyces bullii]|uniref:Uncharacterized protein n=1 Tax=Streptomyces bullii TaxID=349910 RepID=A0ABW0UM09_9ACTN
MKHWPEDAQPVWPEVASATKEIPVANDERGRRVTRDVPRSATADERLLRGIPRQSEGEAEREVLSSQGGADEPLVVRDPWRQHTGVTEHTHDPHEVTVQLDAVQFGDGVLRQARGGPDQAHDGPSDGPVFVDATGRRSRRFRRAGMAVGLVCAGYAVVIAATVLSGNSDAPWLPVPGQQDDRPAGQVDTSPRPAEPAPTDGAATTVPGSAPTADQVTASSPGISATEPGTTARPEQPDGSTAPKPTPTRAAPKPPGTGGTVPTPAPPTDAPTTQPPDPTPTDPPTTGPTEPTDDGGGDDGDGDGGTDTVADGQATAQPVADSPAEQPEQSSPSPAPSSEHVL